MLATARVSESRNVRRLLYIMETKTIQIIINVNSMKEKEVCSIISDGTQDVSKLEAS